MAQFRIMGLMVAFYVKTAPRIIPPLSGFRFCLFRMPRGYAADAAPHPGYPISPLRGSDRVCQPGGLQNIEPRLRGDIK